MKRREHIHPDDRPRLPWLRIGAVFAAGLSGTLLLTALRMDVTRMSYENQALFDREKALIAERSELTVELRQLRSPARLAKQAEARGFFRPERLVDLTRKRGPAASPQGRALALGRSAPRSSQSGSVRP